jgi:hypothetical protein
MKTLYVHELTIYDGTKVQVNRPSPTLDYTVGGGVHEGGVFYSALSIISCELIGCVNEELWFTNEYTTTDGRTFHVTVYESTFDKVFLENGIMGEDGTLYCYNHLVSKRLISSGEQHNPIPIPIAPKPTTIPIYGWLIIGTIIIAGLWSALYQISKIP